MKKGKLFGIIAAFLVSAMSITSIVVSKTKNGESAYDIAVKNGFKGNEKDWLDSLKGSTGATGSQGNKGDDGTTPKLQVNTTTNMWEISYYNYII